MQSELDSVCYYGSVVVEIQSVMLQIISVVLQIQTWFDDVCFTSIQKGVSLSGEFNVLQ